MAPNGSGRQVWANSLIVMNQVGPDILEAGTAALLPGTRGAAPRYCCQKPGDQLPTEPKSMKRMGVSRITVRFALEQLQAEGSLYPFQLSGGYEAARNHCTGASRRLAN